MRRKFFDRSEVKKLPPKMQLFDHFEIQFWTLKSCIFGGVFWLQTYRKNFLRILCYHPRYVKCSPNIALSNETKIMVIRCTGEKIFGKNQNLATENPSSPPSTVGRSSFLAQALTLSLFHFIFGTLQALGSHKPSIWNDTGYAKEDSETITFLTGSDAEVQLFERGSELR